MKGYLNVQTVEGNYKEYHMPIKDEDLSGIPSTYAGRGWIPISAVIKRGAFIRISAEQNNVLYEAEFAITGGQTNLGAYEIRGGQFAGKGKFLSVAPTPPIQARAGFDCQSSSGDGRGLLRWFIAINEYVDADKIAEEGD